MGKELSLLNLSVSLGQDEVYYIPGGSVVKNPPASASDVGSIPGSGRSPGEGKWQPTPVCLTGKFHAQRSLAAYSPWGLRVGHDQSNLLISTIAVVPKILFHESVVY